MGPVQGNVLIIGPTPPPIGGVSIHIQRLTRELAGRSIAYDILNESRIASDGVANLRSISPLGYLKKMWRASLVHIHSSNGTVRLAHTLVARALGVKVLHTVHSLMGTPASLAALRLAVRLGHVTIGVSQVVAGGLGRGSLVVPAFITPDASDETIDADIGAWIDHQKRSGRMIIAVNAFRAEKYRGVDLYGLDLMIEAFEDAHLRERFAAIACIATTQDFEEYQQFLEQKVAALQLDGRFRMIVGPTKFAGVLRRCDVFVRPTLSDGDAISIREALWYGLPVIASDAAPRPTGTTLFRSRDKGQLVDRILATGATAAPQGIGRNYADDMIHIYRDMLSA